MGQCCNTIPWVVNYTLTVFLIILSKNLKLGLQSYYKKVKCGKI